MARVKIIVPDIKIGNFSIPVRISDINYGNHVGNDSIVSILHEARVQWLSNNNFTELNIGSVGLIMADLEIEFKKELLYGDIIEVQLSVGEISRIGFDLYYQLYSKRTGDQAPLANAKTAMICYDYSNKKVAPIPAAFKRLLTP